MISSYICFIASMQYIQEDCSIDTDSWEVRDLLSGIDMQDLFFERTSPTLDPACWFDWKEVVKEVLEKNRSSPISSKEMLTLEQGLVAMQYFIKNRYWIKNNDILLKDAYEDLVNDYNANKDNLESSRLWKEWLIAIAEGKKFDQIFKKRGGGPTSKANVK